MRILRLLALFIVATCLSSAAETRIHVWVKAFIPKSHPTLPNYVRRIGSTDQYVIPAPDSGTACFETDNRLFDADVDASARMTTEFIIVISDDHKTVNIAPAGPRPIHRTGQSKRVKCSDGSVISSGFATTDHMTNGHPAISEQMAQVIVDGQASNPLMGILQGVTPKIDYQLDIRYVFASKRLEARGTLGNFPAFEAYATFNDGPTKNLFKVSPADGATAVALYDLGGVNSRNVDVAVPLP